MKKLILIIIILLTLPTAVFGKSLINQTPMSVSNGLTSWWTFDAPSVVNGVIRDVIGTSNGATVNIATSTFYSVGKINQGLTFDGVDDGIVLSPTVTTGTTFTFCTWIKPDAQVEDYGTVFSFNTGAGFWYRGSGGASNGKIDFYYGSDNLNNTALTNGIWNHYCASVSGGDSTFYLNGIEDGTATGATSFTANNIGDDGGSETYKGSLDDMRFYNRALSLNEIKILRMNGLTTHISPESITSGLVLWYPFEGASIVNGVVKNMFGSANDGKLFSIASSTFYQIGKIKQSVQFDGTNDYIRTASPPISHGPAVPYTVAFWMYKTANIANQSNFFSGDGGGTNEFFASTLHNANGTMFGRICKENVDCRDTPVSGVLPLRTWIHVGITYDGVSTIQTLYINGASTTSSVNNLTGYLTGTSAAAFVGSYKTPSLHFNGRMDDFRMYNRALSQTEMKVLYNTGKWMLKTNI